MNNKYEVGDKVDKNRGYQFPGKVVSVFKTTKGDLRYVVEMKDFGLLHIFNEEQLIYADTDSGSSRH